MGLIFGIFWKIIHAGLFAAGAVILAALMLWGAVSVYAGIEKWHDGAYLAWRFGDEIRKGLPFDMPLSMKFVAGRHRPSLVGDVVYVFHSDYPKGFRGMDWCGQGGFGPATVEGWKEPTCELTLAAEERPVLNYRLTGEGITVFLVVGD